MLRVGIRKAIEGPVCVSVRAELVSTAQQVGDAMWEALRYNTRAEARCRNTDSIERIQYPRQSVTHSAILCREVRRTIRFYVNAQRDLQHATIGNPVEEN